VENGTLNKCHILFCVFFGEQTGVNEGKNTYCELFDISLTNVTHARMAWMIHAHVGTLFGLHVWVVPARQRYRVFFDGAGTDPTQQIPVIVDGGRWVDGWVSDCGS
jgi:hypothetical protein